MASHMIYGFILGFLTCSTVFIIINVHNKGNIRFQPICKTDNKEYEMRPTLPTSRSSSAVSSTAAPHKPRVLCWIMTSPDTLYSKATHVKKTWGRRCDHLLFFSSKPDESFPCIGTNTSEGRQHLWGKTRQAFLHIYNYYFDKADWFMKADDDTYVIVENLRHFLSTKNSSDALYYGHQFRHLGQNQEYSGYNSGGSGYVLSKEALKRFGMNVISTPKFCSIDGADEDLRMGSCLTRLGVKTVNTSDQFGFITFFCFDLEWVVLGKYPHWYKSRGVHSKQWGIGNFSRNAISFHYITPWMMYVLDYFVYRFSLHKEYGDSDSYMLRQNDWIPVETFSTTGRNAQVVAKRNYKPVLNISAAHSSN